MKLFQLPCSQFQQVRFLISNFFFQIPNKLQISIFKIQMYYWDFGYCILFIEYYLWFDVLFFEILNNSIVIWLFIFWDFSLKIQNCFTVTLHQSPNFQNTNQLLMVCVKDFCFSVVNYEIPKLKFQIPNKLQISSSK